MDIKEVTSRFNKDLAQANQNGFAVNISQKYSETKFFKIKKTTTEITFASK